MTATGKSRPELVTLEDAEILSRLQTYKRAVARRYRVLPPEGLEQNLPKGNLWISPKLDGELWFLLKRAGRVVLCAYNGRILEGSGVEIDAEARLEGVGSALVAGELFAALPGVEGRPRCFHVSRALSEPALRAHLSFHPFDLLEEDGRNALGSPYVERLARLRALFPEGAKLGTITSVEGDAAMAAAYFREWVATQKFEGLVVRSEQGLTFKIKPAFSLDAVVVAFGERVVQGVTQNVKEMRELELALLRDDGSLHLLGSVGGGFSQEDRVRWRERLAPLTVPSAFRLANRDGTLCHFVKPEIVVEVRCHDLVDTDGSDVPIQRMTLRYAPGAGYAPLGPLPFVSPISPVFLRERGDKRVDAGSVGLDQVYSRIPFEARFGAAERTPAVEPRVLKRVVYVKEMKGQVAVRKYVALATGRASDSSWPPYVVYFTDYSDGRAEPLKVSLRVAGSQESLDRHIATWVAENVKRGWSEHGAAAPEPGPEAAPADKPAKAKRTKKTPEGDPPAA
jgi:hypothetical protein